MLLDVPAVEVVKVWAVVAMLSIVPVTNTLPVVVVKVRSLRMSKSPLMAMLPVVVVRLPPKEVCPPPATLVIPALAVMLVSYAVTNLPLLVTDKEPLTLTVWLICTEPALA
ncbi:hypothetical protein LTEGF4_12530 [Limnohabitans sp. TEGF004]|nr:hypothetical protein LTEGF4_12530 [Limnohabitans sp. TEGF004]